jgi:hypothetical protein
VAVDGLAHAHVHVVRDHSEVELGIQHLAVRLLHAFLIATLTSFYLMRL